MRAGQMVVRGIGAGRASAGEGVRDVVGVLCVRLNVEIRAVVLDHIGPVRDDARVPELYAGLALAAVNGRHRADLHQPREDRFVVHQ